MVKKLDILRLFRDEESLTPSDLANLLDINQNYGRQIVLRLKRQGLIFPLWPGGKGYSLTDKGEARITYLADKEKGEVERREKEAFEQRKQSGMYLHELITGGLPGEIERRIRTEFNISIQRLGSKRLNEIALPQKTWEETGLLGLKRETKFEHLELPFDRWIRLLQNISKPTPRSEHLLKPFPTPQYLSLEEVIIISTLTERKKGDFFVTKEGEVLYAPGKGYLTLEAAAILAECRKKR